MSRVRPGWETPLRMMPKQSAKSGGFRAARCSSPLGAKGVAGGYHGNMGCSRIGSVLRMYVGGIGDGATEPEVYAAFASVGVRLSHVELVVNRATGCPRGFAFVAVAEGPKAGRAKATDDILSRMRLALLGGRSVTVQPIGRELALRPICGLTAGGGAFANSPKNGASQAGPEETGPGP